MQFTPLGDSALMVELGDAINESTHHRVQAAWRALAAEPLPGVSEAVPAYTSVTVFYDPWRVMQAGASAGEVIPWLTARIKERLKDPPKSAKTKPRTVEIPVCYGGDFGPDL
ncbi:MAG: carboxyltransferase domain-containing protein, partial [Opitutus sp.]